MTPRGRTPLDPAKRRGHVQLVRFNAAEHARVLSDLAKWRAKIGDPLASLAAYIRHRLGLSDR